MKESYFNLDVNASLFTELAMNPEWWKILKNDSDLYVNIRKSNRINVYYRGASIMNLTHSPQKGFESVIHNYYLGVDKEIAERLGIQYGEIKMPPQDIISRLKTIKYRVRSNNKYEARVEEKEDEKESYSEKYMQSKMYLNKDDHYIDTEFELSLDDGTQIRIDLVKIDNAGNVQFVELKRVQDNRLITSKEKPAEIITQMDNYQRFLEEANCLSSQLGKNVIAEYYRKVLIIMEKIGLEPPVGNKDIMGLADTVKLFITNYEKKGSKRFNRLQLIRDICVNYDTNIDDVIESYCKLQK